MPLVMPQNLKFVDSSKIQKFKYHEKKNIFSSNKKNH